MERAAHWSDAAWARCVRQRCWAAERPKGRRGSQLSSGWAVGLTRARSGPSAGLAEREKLGRPVRGRRAGPGEGNGPAGERGGLRVGLRSWVWAGLTLGVGLLSISLLLNLIQTKFEFKYEFEFKPHSNKSVHQHECNTNF